MTLMRNLALAALVLTAACSQKPAATNAASAAGGAAAPPAASGPDTVITMDQLPRPKAGLWEITTTEAGGKPEVSRHCETGEPVKPEMGKDCKLGIKRTFLGGVVIDATCGAEGVSSNVQSTINGDFNASYTSDTEGSINVPGHAAMVIKTHSEGRYVGPCPAAGGED